MHIFRWATAMVACVLATAAAAEKHAFVLGNAAYTDLSALQNTLDDARAYSEAFKELGYKVSSHSNLGLDDMEDAIATFVAGIDPGDEVIFVFSGHGWSNGSVNYLIPTDAPAQGSDRKLARNSIALRNGDDGVLDDLERSGAGLTVAVIDACRNNPFKPRPGTKSAAGMTRGLAPVTAPQGSFVIFSAGEGQEALDRLPDDPADQKLSVFNRTFLPHLKSGVFLETAISNAQVETAALARKVGGHLQHPAYYDQTLGQTCLTNGCQVAVAQPKASACDLLYSESKSIASCGVYKAYLDTCAQHALAPIVRGLADEKQCFARAETTAEVPEIKVAKVKNPSVQVVAKTLYESSNLSMRGVYSAPDSQNATRFTGGVLSLHATDRSGWYQLADDTGFVKLTNKEQQGLVTAALKDAPVEKLAGTDGKHAWQRVSVNMSPIRAAPNDSARLIRFAGGQFLLGAHAGSGWYELRNEPGAFLRVGD